MLKKLVLLALAVVIVLAVVCVVRAATVSLPEEKAAPADAVTIDANAAAQHLAGALKFATVSNQDATLTATDQLDALHAYLEQTYPKFHAAAHKEVVAGHSLLYEWKGSDPSLAPVLLLAHLDVVPVEPATASQWTHPAFDGVVADGYVWGRGAMDDKGPLIAVLEAAELLAGEGYAPRRTVLFAFGHNEEVGGSSAVELARLLESRNVHAESVIDEGMSISVGVVANVSRPVALIGTAEKGYLTLELVAEAEGGHSSMPPPQTTVGILSRAVDRLEANPFPARLDGPTRMMVEGVAPAVENFGQKLALTNLWLFKPVVIATMSKNPRTNASLRTTTAPTMFEAGVKENVLPAHSRAVVNFRLLPGDTIESVTEHVRNTIADERVKVNVLAATKSEPSPTSPVDSEPYRLIASTIHQEFPTAVITPMLVLGATDARHYTKVSPNIYRFVPSTLGMDDLKRVHSLDERLSVENLANEVKWYRQYLKNTTSR